jgi:hypothetical protein
MKNDLEADRVYLGKDGVVRDAFCCCVFGYEALF